MHNNDKRCNIHVRQIRRDRERLNSQEEYDDKDWDSVSDLIKILEKDHQYKTRRGLLLTLMQQVLVALRFYATGTFQKVTGDLFGVSVFAACIVIHKVSRAIAKQNVIPIKLGKFCDVAHFSLSSFFFSLFSSLFTFYDVVHYSRQCKSCFFFE